MGFLRRTGVASGVAASPPLADIAPSVVLLSVVAFVPGGLFPFAWPKIAIVGVALLIHVLVPVRRARLQGTDLLLVVAAIFWVLVSGLAAEAVLPSLVGRWPRYEGVPVIAAYAGCLLLGARVLGGDARDSQRAVDWAIHSAAGVAVVVAGIAAVESLGYRPLGGVPDLRPGSTLGNATDLGLIAVMLVGLLLPKAIVSRSPFVIGSVVVAAATVGMSGSRAALLGLLIVLGVVAAGVLVRWPASSGHEPIHPTFGSGQTARIAFVAGLVLFAVIAMPAIRERILFTSTISGRFVLWESTLPIVMADPWVGAGASGFVDALPEVVSRSAAIQLGGQTVHDSPHAWVLQAAVAGGVVLAGLAVAFAVRVVFAGLALFRASAPWSPIKLGAFAAVCGYGVALLTHFTGPGTTPLAGMLAGIVLARGGCASNSVEGHPTLKATGRIAGVGLTVLLLVGAMTASAAERSLARALDLLAVADVANADSAFRTALSLRPWDTDIALHAAQALATSAAEGVLGAPEATVVWAQRSLDHNPRSVEAGVALAVGLMQSGSISEAVDTLNAINARAPHVSLVHLQRGIALFGLGETEAAILDIEEAAALDPTSPTPLVVLSRIFEQIGDSEASEEALREAEARILSSP